MVFTADYSSNTPMIAECRYDSLIVYYSQVYSRNPQQVKRQIRMESNFDPDAVSKAGCKGLMQFGDLTWKEWYDGTAGVQSPPPGFVLPDPRDPEDSIRAGCAYMHALEHSFGHLEYALAAYNWGPTKLRHAMKGILSENTRWITILPPETARYVLNCLSFKQEVLVCTA